MEEKIIEIIERLSNYKNLKDNIEIDLLESDIIDSLTFIELITALEEEFNIEIQITQVKPETWRNINKIVDLVKSLM